ncbi:esterase [Modestobacter sp. I12A-02628]|uniref:Esterase n=1 Tax=Goekera deserti TaxID=2497753 RepID=A0A7K3W8N0_9ACTN|nr:esterase [Goekera deserti]MPR00248.1 esterase [Goekera deserti]NDI49422.1 esterase [Goekera deserti]NEL52704.1 esterase [Goekera deserti]
MVPQSLLHWPPEEVRAALPPVVLLHGSGQDERSLLTFAARACPGHPLVPVRGRIPWESGFAFFRRNPDRTLDLADLAEGAAALQELLSRLREVGHRPPILLGYSNGAIVAAAALARDATAAAGAVLLRPLTPAPNAPLPAMSACPVLLVAATHDERRKPQDARTLYEQLLTAGAAPMLVALPAGHPLTVGDAAVVAAWLGALVARTGGTWSAVRAGQEQPFDSGG